MTEHFTDAKSNTEMLQDLKKSMDKTLSIAGRQAENIEALTSIIEDLERRLFVLENRMNQ